MTIRSMTVTDARDATARSCCRGPLKCKTIGLIAGLVCLVIVSALGGYFIGKADYTSTKRKEPPDPVEPLLASPSWLHVFQRAAVCTDAPHCSQIGRDILSRNGSAVDAGIAAMFCNGLLNMQSMGLGGGFFMTVYIKADRKAYVVNAREKAPSAASQNMFDGNSDKARRGALAVAVPGELRGMWAAHERWGRLSWRDVVSPTLEFCKYGFPMSKVLYDGTETASWIKNDPNLKKMFVDSDGMFHKPTTIVKPPDTLCNTLKRIAETDGHELYNGTLATEFLDDLKRAGSIITANDLKNYEAQISEPISVSLPDGDTLYSPPPPSSGVILGSILTILSGYNFSSNSINSTQDKILTYHRIIEAFKHGYATRSKLGDKDFVPLDELIHNVTTPEYSAHVRSLINDSRTSNDTAAYGGMRYSNSDSGTAHISIIAGNGDAVSITSSVNFYFGAGFTTLNTGIIMNNVMDDFSSPGFQNSFGIPPAEANFIAPNKRPLSSMSPTIIVDNNGNAKLVIGASGGSKITTAIAMVTMRKLWFGQTIKEAVDEARIHHQLLPMEMEYEFGIIEDILQGLKAKGHAVRRYRGRGSIVCALFRNSSAIYANADFRKGGDVAGMD